MKQETKFKIKVKADLETLRHAWFFKSNEVSVRGIPDYIICLNGLFIAIELKKDASGADPLQSYIGQKIHKKGGGIFYVANPLNWPDIFEELQRLDCA